MRYDQLPVYKETYDLSIHFYRSSQTIKREYRYTIGEELKRRIDRILTCVYLANRNHDKEQYLLEARECIEIVKLKIRQLHDLHQMPIRNMARFSLSIENISKQLAAWHKANSPKKTERKPPQPQQEEEETTGMM